MNCSHCLYYLKLCFTGDAYIEKQENKMLSGALIVEFDHSSIHLCCSLYELNFAASNFVLVVVLCDILFVKFYHQ